MARCRLYRTWLGGRFSEGARRLWLIIRENGWSQAHIMRLVDAADGVVGRWLYGDRCPSPIYAKLLEERLGILRDWWLTPPAEPFVVTAELHTAIFDRMGAGAS